MVSATGIFCACFEHNSNARRPCAAYSSTTTVDIHLHRARYCIHTSATTRAGVVDAVTCNIKLFATTRTSPVNRAQRTRVLRGTARAPTHAHAPHRGHIASARDIDRV
eukprot:PhM_4_TR15229/c0_g1_i3/m.95191